MENRRWHGTGGPIIPKRHGSRRLTRWLREDPFAFRWASGSPRVKRQRRVRKRRPSSPEATSTSSIHTRSPIGEVDEPGGPEMPIHRRLACTAFEAQPRRRGPSTRPSPVGTGIEPARGSHQLERPPTRLRVRGRRSVTTTPEHGERTPTLNHSRRRTEPAAIRPPFRRRSASPSCSSQGTSRVCQPDVDDCRRRSRTPRAPRTRGPG